MAPVLIIRTVRAGDDEHVIAMICALSCVTDVNMTKPQVCMQRNKSANEKITVLNTVIAI